MMLPPEVGPPKPFRVLLSKINHKRLMLKNMMLRFFGLYRARGYYPQDPKNLRYWDDVKREFPG